VILIISLGWHSRRDHVLWDKCKVSRWQLYMWKNPVGYIQCLFRSTLPYNP
jgi:hypothetical protein